MDLSNTTREEGPITDLPKVLTELRQRIQSLEASAEVQKVPRSWQRRLVILEAIYSAGGHVVNGLAAAGIANSSAYYHRNVDRLFRDCWRYIVEAGRAGYHEQHSWRVFWPDMLTIPELEVSAAVNELVPRLGRARVLPSGRQE